MEIGLLRTFIYNLLYFNKRFLFKISIIPYPNKGLAQCGSNIGNRQRWHKFRDEKFRLNQIDLIIILSSLLKCISNGFTRHRAVIKKHLTQLLLKPLNECRWRVE